MRKHIDIPAAFTQARKKWGGNGSGSDPANVAKLLAGLPGLLEKYGIRRVVDLGCGDVEWIAPLARTLDEYTGADVVAAPIAANAAKYPELKFLLINGPDDELPKADLVIIRDCLAHLPCHIVSEVLAQARRCAPLVLATSFTKSRANLDCKAGAFRPLNLQARPFDLPHPLETIEDTGHKSMCLWRMREPDAVRAPVKVEAPIQEAPAAPVASSEPSGGRGDLDRLAAGGDETKPKKGKRRTKGKVSPGGPGPTEPSEAE